MKPRQVIFKPAGVPLNRLEEVLLLPEELEALRLADLEGKMQAQAAQEMGVSRSTFQRILTQARRQVSRALVEGCALRLQDETVIPMPPAPRGPRREGPTKKR